MPNFVVLTFAPARKGADGYHIGDCAGKKKIALLKVFTVSWIFTAIRASANGTDCVVREPFRFRFGLNWGFPLDCSRG